MLLPARDPQAINVAGGSTFVAFQAVHLDLKCNMEMPILTTWLFDRSWSSLVKGDEHQDHPNSQTNIKCYHGRVA